MKHKKLFIAGITLFSIVVFLAVFLLIWFWGDTYPDMSDFTVGAEIPGLDEDAVPQGLANYSTSYSYTDANGNEQEGKQEYFFISAYVKEGPSRLYVTGSRTGYVGYVTMKYRDLDDENADEDGYVDYYGHAGGVATSCKSGERNGTLWVVSDGTVYCAKRSSNDYVNIAEEVIARASLSEQGENVIKFGASFSANCNASFCYFYEDGTSSVTSDKLYVGEFYRKNDERYNTAENHRVITPTEEEQYAFVYEYTSNTSTDNVYGLTLISATDVPEENKVPRIYNIYSIPDKIQGFTRTANGSLVLSESYALSNSHLYYYNWNDVFSTSNRALYSKLMETTMGKAVNFAYEGVYYARRGDQNPVQYTDSALYVYFIDETKILRDYSIPSMAEGLCANGDRVYVLFESGCYKYKPFVRQIMDNLQYFNPRTK